MNATHTICAGHLVGVAMLAGHINDLAKKKDSNNVVPDAAPFLASFVSREGDIEE